MTDITSRRTLNRTVAPDQRKREAGGVTGPPDGGFGDPDELMEPLEVPAGERQDALAVLAEVAMTSPEEISGSFFEAPDEFRRDP